MLKNKSYPRLYHVDETNQREILSDLAATHLQKGKLFKAFIFSSTAYMLYVAVDLTFNTKNFTPKKMDWPVAVFLLALPFFGMGFHLAGKKIGWVFNTFYYVFVSSLFVYSFVKDIYTGYHYPQGLNWRGLLFIALSLISAAFIISKPVKKYFGISMLFFILVLCIGIGLAATMALTVLK